MKYWDKFVRRKAKLKFVDQADEQTLQALLGQEKAPGDSVDMRSQFDLLFSSKIFH